MKLGIEQRYNMDALEQWLNTFWQSSIKQRTLLTREKQSVCVCSSCSSYNRCAGEIHESVYCITGKSHLCITEDRGCTCTRCPLVAELGLKYSGFCRDGAEAAQRYEHELH